MIYTGRKIAYIPGDSIMVRQPAAAAIWLPTNITGLQLWIDFSDATKLFTDAGTTPVSSDGDLIYQANDKSGNGYNFTQSTSGARPTYKVNIKNGLSVGRNAYGDFMISGVDTPFDFTNTFTLAAVIKWANEANEVWINKGYNNYNSSGWYINKGALVGSVSGSAKILDAGGNHSTYNLMIFNLSSGNGTSRLNGANGGTVSGWTNTPNITNLNMGEYNYTSPGANGLNGDFCEILIYSGSISAPNQSLIENYLNAKWAVY